MIQVLPNSTKWFWPDCKCGSQSDTGGYCAGHAYPYYVFDYKQTLNPPKAQVGWVCPVCGSGCAPWLSKCGCKTTITLNGSNTSSTNSTLMGLTGIGSSGINVTGLNGVPDTNGV